MFVTSVEQRKNNLKTQNFLYPMLIIDEKHLYFFTKLKTYHLSYSIYKHDAMDIADPSSLQDTCHMNFVIDLAHHSVSVVQW